MSHLPKTVISAAAKAIADSGEFVDGRFKVDADALNKIAGAISPTPRGHFLDAIRDASDQLAQEAREANSHK